MLLAVGAKYRRLRSSMLVAIERGREPAVDFLNGEVVRRAARSSASRCRSTSRVQELIGAIWRRERQPGLALLRELYEESRSEVYAATAGGYRAEPARSARGASRALDVRQQLPRLAKSRAAEGRCGSAARLKSISATCSKLAKRASLVWPT